MSNTAFETTVPFDLLFLKKNPNSLNFLQCEIYLCSFNFPITRWIPDATDRVNPFASPIITFTFLTKLSSCCLRGQYPALQLCLFTLLLAREIRDAISSVEQLWNGSKDGQSRDALKAAKYSAIR